MVETGNGHRVSDVLSCESKKLSCERSKRDGVVPLLDLQVLLAFALRKPKEYLYTHPDYELSGSEYAVLEGFLARRRSGEPVAYITGEKEFYSLTFKVNRSVLIPRTETELLVDEVLELSPRSVLDVGTGSGNIAVAVKYHLRSCFVLACDASEEALTLAAENARAILGVNDILFVRSRFFEGLARRGPDSVMPGGEPSPKVPKDSEKPDGSEDSIDSENRKSPRRFSLIVSNPPYVMRGALGTLQREVREYEPALALDGGEDGLDAYRAVLSRARDFLVPGGRIVLETDPAILAGLLRLAREAGFTLEKVVKDLSGLDRMVVIA